MPWTLMFFVLGRLCNSVVFEHYAHKLGLVLAMITKIY